MVDYLSMIPGTIYYVHVSLLSVNSVLFTGKQKTLNIPRRRSLRFVNILSLSIYLSHNKKECKNTQTTF